MTGDHLIANADQYLQAAGLNVPPPLITSDPLVAGSVPIEQLLRVLGIAANASDPTDNAESAEAHAERDAQVHEAAAKFTAQDEAAANQLAQQMPQLAAGMASSLGGALGGILQPMTQIPQQLAQGAQQAMQAAMGMAQQFGGEAPITPDEDLAFPDDFSSDTTEPAGGSSGGGGSGGGGAELTAPTAMLGPAPVPAAATTPASAPVAPPTPPSTPAQTTPHSTGMGGMPLMPPGAMRGADGSNQETKPDAKRLSVAPVKNGAPVQGRLIAPPIAPQVVKKVEGNPLATKRIIVPNNKILRDPQENQQQT